jgi:ribosomal protein L37AE/L43A
MNEIFQGFDSDAQDEMYRKVSMGYRSDSYSGESCKNCSRQRVMLCYNGRKICEKCGWDQEKNEYSDYLTR